MRYDQLNEILKLDISDELKTEFKKKFNKRIYFEWAGVCKIGTLIGYYEPNNYIIKVSDTLNYYLPIESSISILE